jgi:excisionase family DNA binding protein
MMTAMAELTTREAAERLGRGVRAVQALITKGHLPAIKKGRDYLIREADLKLVAGIKPGPKPAKSTSEKRKRAA